MTGVARGGVVFVISAASGTGKTTLCHRLVRACPDLRYAVSATTRAPREGEGDGVDYHFLTRAAFDRRIAEGRFLEWAEVHGNRYGTPVEEVEAARRSGLDLVLDLDTQGAFQVRERCADAVLIFILPPTTAELQRRLRLRGRDDETTIQRRLAVAERELAEAPNYDHVVVNDELDVASAELAALVTAERQRATRTLERKAP